MEEKNEPMLTPWMDGPPPWVGWWETRLQGSPHTRKNPRRWFNGETYSLPVTESMPEEDMRHRQVTPGFASVLRLQYRGLALEAPSYPYHLVSTDRTARLTKATRELIRRSYPTMKRRT